MKATSLGTIENVIGGKAVPSRSSAHEIVTNPATGEGLAHVPLSTRADLDDAVTHAAEAHVAWAAVPVKDRVQVIYRMKTLMETQSDRLCELIREENGKTLAEAQGSVARAVECLEFASGLPMAPDSGLDVSAGVECRSKRFPLGVVAGITPFNFPLMVPLWMAPNAIACGNAFILKPSEQTPLSALELARLFAEAGLPPGVFSVVHGGREIVEAICDHPGIAAIGFVGSTAVARAVYERGCRHHKRVRALGGAKNHLIVVPDADPEMTASNVVASVTGCAGQRCMAASVLLAVGDVDPILSLIHDKMSAIVAGRDIGPLISEAARTRISGVLDGVGDKLILDGRMHVAEDAPAGGYYLGPCIIDHAAPSDSWSCDEIFGPILTIIRCKTLEEALAIENGNPYGNAAAVYTSSGKVADRFVQAASAGMVGINVGVPVPREPFPFGGWNESSFGDGDLTGISGVEFWSRTKKITSKWSAEGSKNWMS